MSAQPKVTEEQDTPTLELVPPLNPRFVPTERLAGSSDDDPFYAAVGAVLIFCVFAWFSFELTIWAVQPSIGF